MTIEIGNNLATSLNVLSIVVGVVLSIVSLARMGR